MHIIQHTIVMQPAMIKWNELHENKDYIAVFM